MPGVLTQIVSVLYLFVGNFSFVQPGCGGLTRWIDIYGINVSGTVQHV